MENRAHVESANGVFRIVRKLLRIVISLLGLVVLLFAVVVSAPFLFLDWVSGFGRKPVVGGPL